jgi:hypothetical protein
MDEYMIVRTCIPKQELERVREDFDENLVSVGTLSDPGHCLDSYGYNYMDYEYSSELDVTKEGHLLVDYFVSDRIKRAFERLKALPPSERWAEALEIAKEWAGAEIAALTGKEAPKSREEAVATLRQFLAEKALEVDVDTIRKISNMLFALEEDSCNDYPFSENIKFFEDWHYLDDTDSPDAHTENSIEAIAFALLETGYGG